LFGIVLVLLGLVAVSGVGARRQTVDVRGVHTSTTDSAGKGPVAP
jgi:hypothetical protein